MKEGAALSLLVTSCSRVFAIPAADVVETMRPMPVNPIAGLPGFVLGVAIVRGSAVPVVDLGAVAGAGRSEAVGRFVTLRLDDRIVAVAVEAVLGVRTLAGLGVDELPPLLRDAAAEVFDSIGVLDHRLLVVLRAGRLVPAEILAGLFDRVSAS